MITAREIAQQLAQRADEVSRYLFPNGKKEGNEWCVGNIHGESGKSLKIHLIGDKAGIWSDFADGISGDLLDLWAQRHNLKMADAIKEAACYLNVSLPTFEPNKNKVFNKPLPPTNSKLHPFSPVMRYLKDERKLKEEIIYAYKISEINTEIIFPYLRDNAVVFMKYLGLDRTNNKKKVRVESNCEPCLFGWHMLPDNTRIITICEGEIDAMTLTQYGIPALSVPFGAGGGKKHEWITYEYERLSVFDEIFLCMDNDKEGKIATKELIERLGRQRCKVVTLPYKDANECLLSGITEDEIKKCFSFARTLDPEELKPANYFVDQVIDEFYPPPGAHIGYEVPWYNVRGKITFRPNELSVWTGINGHGKSQFLGQIILHAMSQGARVCIASLEIKPKRLLMRLTRQAGALAEPAVEYIKAIHGWYEDKLWIFDLVGTAKIKRLLEVFLYARQRYNIDVFVIDSFMKLDIAEDDYKAQKSFMEALCDFKNQYDCHIHIVVHPRKGLDESRPPGKLDNKGTGAITDLADNCFSVWRNKEKEHLLQRQKNGALLIGKELEKISMIDCLWSCDKQRNGDSEGRFGFWFHHASMQYLDNPQHKPIRLVAYSNRSVS